MTPCFEQDGCGSVDEGASGGEDGHRLCVLGGAGVVRGDAFRLPARWRSTSQRCQVEREIREQAVLGNATSWAWKRFGGGRKYTGNTRPLLGSRPRKQEHNLQRIRGRNSKTPTRVELVCYRDGWVEGTFFCTSS